MPSANTSAAANACRVPLRQAAARATPTAKPSGMLWSVTAKISIVFLESALSCRLLPRRRRSIAYSLASKKPIPSKKPTVGKSHRGSAALSSAGINSDHILAATITPAAKPRSSFSLRPLTFRLIKNTAAAPSAVPANGMRIPVTIKKITCTYCMLNNQSR